MTAVPAVLVSMPFLEVERPSIQLGLLKAIADQHGLPVRTLHLNLDFAVRIGLDYYRSWPSTGAGNSATGCSRSRRSATPRRIRTGSCSPSSAPNCPTWTDRRSPRRPGC